MPTAGESPPSPPGPSGSQRTWPDVLGALTRREDLDAADASWAMTEVMSGRATEAQLSALLMGLRVKGETVTEVAAMARVMVEHAVPLEVSGPVLDVVGTGGDGSGSVNLSTAAALVAAGAGARVVKHGNRAASSRCGSADVLQALGVDIDPGPAAVARLAAELGVAFCFAQRFHPAMRHAAGVRRSLGVRTVFNLLGPLTNPARPTAMALGVADAGRMDLVAGALAADGVTALVLRGDDGLDEFSTTSPTEVRVVVGGEVAAARVDARDLGVPRADLTDLAGGDATENAAAIRRVLAGEAGPVADAVLVNAAAALVAADLATGAVPVGVVVDRLGDLMATGLGRARTAVDSGRAEAVLTRWVAGSG
ncbi:MAG: anthranilate phosphoribosyltransferase [Kineosporiaceae bacterium]